MEALNLISGESHFFDLTEDVDAFFDALLRLSETGLNLQFTFTDIGELFLFQSRFDEDNPWVDFMENLREKTGSDDWLHYYQIPAGLTPVFVTYDRRCVK